MKSTKVAVRWIDGLHLRQAARIVRCAQGFTSGISLRLDDELADAGSILSVVTLCAMLGSVIEVEVSGEDEQQALAAIVEVFATNLDETRQA